MIYDEISKNKIKTIFIIVFFIVFMYVISYFFSYLVGYGKFAIIVAGVIAILMSFIMYYNSDKIALSLSKAKPASIKNYKQYHNIVEGLCIAAEIPKPKLYIIEDESINAFATGRNYKKSAIAVTLGALKKLKRDELEGVIAHELSHIKNKDMLVMTLASVMAGFVIILSDIFIRTMWFGGTRRREGGNIILFVIGIVLLIVAPVFAQMIKFAISRKREYLADSSGALLTRNPTGLANALKKIKYDHLPTKTATKATAHLFFSNPLKGDVFSRLFSTHPPIDERIKRLEKMGYKDRL